jgi:hypothetical protein
LIQILIIFFCFWMIFQIGMWDVSGKHLLPQHRTSLPLLPSGVPFVHFDVLSHPQQPSNSLVICGKDSTIWIANPTPSNASSGPVRTPSQTSMGGHEGSGASDAEMQLLVDMQDKLPALSKKYKMYQVIVHPLQPHLHFLATNFGVVVLSVHMARVPSIAYRPPLDDRQIVYFARGGRLFVREFTEKEGETIVPSVPQMPLDTVISVSPSANYLGCFSADVSLVRASLFF